MRTKLFALSAAVALTGAVGSIAACVGDEPGASPGTTTPDRKGGTTNPDRKDSGTTTPDRKDSGTRTPDRKNTDPPAKDNPRRGTDDPPAKTDPKNPPKKDKDRDGR